MRWTPTGIEPMILLDDDDYDILAAGFTTFTVNLRHVRVRFVESSDRSYV